MAKIQTGCKLKVIRSDNGGEYISNRFIKYCIDHGILKQFTTVYICQQNGIAERMNWTLVESAKCILFHTKISIIFWAEAIATTLYILNRSPIHTVLDFTLEE